MLRTGQQAGGSPWPARTKTDQRNKEPNAFSSIGRQIQKKLKLVVPTNFPQEEQLKAQMKRQGKKFITKASKKGLLACFLIKMKHTRPDTISELKTIIENKQTSKQAYPKRMRTKEQAEKATQILKNFKSILLKILSAEIERVRTVEFKEDIFESLFQQDDKQQLKATRQVQRNKYQRHMDYLATLLNQQVTFQQPELAPQLNSDPVEREEPPYIVPVERQEEANNSDHSLMEVEPILLPEDLGWKESDSELQPFDKAPPEEPFKWDGFYQYWSEQNSFPQYRL